MKLLISNEELNLKKSRDLIKCECILCKKIFEKQKKYITKELKYNKGEVRFCSKSCSTTYTNSFRVLSDTTKNKIKNSIIKFNQQKERYNILYTYDCESCGIEFSSIKIKNDRKKTCENCRKTKVIRDIKNVNNIYELSNRTRVKIIKKSKIKCAICEWDKTTLDIHHINGKKVADANNHNNLICLCPNCHRLAHENKLEKELLLDNSLDKKLSNWRDFYNE